jgi:hypothetical protein
MKWGKFYYIAIFPGGKMARGKGYYTTPVFVCKTPEENAKSKTLPRILRLILFVICSVIMP